MKTKNKNTGQIKMSVIVPVYNVGEYIGECLNSLIGQDSPNIEMILVDDGSTDNSGCICDEYAKKDSRITVLHKANGGLVSARKAGLEAATGIYTTYVDSDDWIEEAAYEELIPILEQYEPDVVNFDFKKEYQKFSVEYTTELKEGLYVKEEFLNKIEETIEKNHFFCPVFHITVWSKIFKTELLRKYQFVVDDEIRIGEDFAVVLPYLLNAESIYIKRKAFYHYRVRKTSMMWNKGADEFGRYQKLAQLIWRLRETINKRNMEQYLIYSLYKYLILCSPNYLMNKDGSLLLFSEVKKGDSVIVYGKGVFANNLVQMIKKIGAFYVLTMIDCLDVERILQIPKDSWKYIIVAITEYTAVSNTLMLLEKLGIDMKKVLYIKKELLTIENLPVEVQDIII